MLCGVLALLSVWAAGAGPGATQRAVSVLADFEDASIAASIGDVDRVSAADCAVRRVSLPARGKGSLALEIGATAHGVSVACDLTFREPTRFYTARRVVTYCWIDEGEFDVIFRIRDAQNQMFESGPQRVRLTHRWVELSAELDPDKLQRVRGSAPLSLPIQIAGYRVTTERRGKQTILLDDLLIEQWVAAPDLIHGRFEFDQPTHLYEPGSTVAAQIVLENQSREQRLAVAVNLAWMRPDGSELAREQASIALPPSGGDFRSYRRLDFSQRIREPGLYKLVAEVRAPRWPAPRTFETTIAVTPSNRRLSRGRSTFFGVRSNLLREPLIDQMLEISVARDIGANMLAIDVPWRRIQPRADTLDFSVLDPIVAAISQQDMAAMVILTEPPPWVPADPQARQQRIATLIDALVDHFGGRLMHFQLDAAVVGEQSTARQLNAVRRLRAHLADADLRAVVLPPAIPVENLSTARDVAGFVQEQPDFPLAFATRGDLTGSLDRLETYRRQGGFRWQVAHHWVHESEPLSGPGYYYDAEAVLRHYVRAAAVGVGGLLWSELRDDDNDPEDRARLRGLVRRDFSPKTSLLGYAAAAGRLTGYRCAGKVAGTPETFESALFIGADRQIAVLLPRRNRVLPAVLAPQRGEVRGDFTVQDFERREHAVFTSAAPALIPTVPRPLFLTLDLREPQPDPQLRLTRPWLRVPATVFCGAEARFTVEIDAVVPLRRSYLQVRLPVDSPVETSLSAAAISIEARESVAFDVHLTPRAGKSFERAELMLRVSLEGRSLDIPLEVRPLDVIPLITDSASVEDQGHRARLVAPDDQRPTAEAVVTCAYTSDALHLAVVVDDDRVVPAGAGRNTIEGDRLMVGVVRVGSDRHAEGRIDPAATNPVVEPFAGTPRALVTGWRCRVERSGEGEPRLYHITIPGSALGQRGLAAGTRLRVAVRYVDDDADGFAPLTLRWGGGLEGSHSTDEFRWMELGGR